jgi:hypothetical protein
VRDSDATLVLTRSNARSPGTSVAVAAAESLEKPYLIVDVDTPDAAERIRLWLSAHPDIRILSIGGPRESESPGIYDTALMLLKALA